jgi:hypothetical protein
MQPLEELPAVMLRSLQKNVLAAAAMIQISPNCWLGDHMT